MPTYQYACTECGERLEVVQKFTDDALTVCPACAGRLRKLFSPVGVVFKGSGFYKTDSRGTTKTGADAKPAAASGASGGSGGESTPSKPAADSSSSSPSSSAPAPASSPASSDKGGGGSKVA